MKTIKGKYNEAKIFTDNVEYACMDQVKNLVNCGIFAGEQIRIMPDCHAGTGCVVGYTQTTKNSRIVPNLVGSDIGCGMSYIKIPAVAPKKLDEVIHQYIPAGFDVHKPGKLPGHLVNGVIELMDKMHTPIDDNRRARIMNSIGTLGGGNHFLEMDVCVETGESYLVVHTGSRNLGMQTFRYWQSIAEKATQGRSRDIQGVVKKLKAEGRTFEIESEIKKIKASRIYVPKELSYLEGEEKDRYLHDVSLCQKFAEDNRQLILAIIIDKLGILFKEKDIKSTIHNYIDLERGIIRKGSISAEADEEVLIPMNMRDGSLICIGKGNQDWNYSAPHGAGRIMSRSMARKCVSMDDFRISMKNIYTTSVSESTLDESPMVYKDAAEIESLIEDTVEVRYHLKPIYNFKSGGSDYGG